MLVAGGDVLEVLVVGGGLVVFVVGGGLVVGGLVAFEVTGRVVDE